MRLIKRHIAVVVLSLLTLSACGDDLFELPSGFGRFEGRLNDAPWNGYGYAVIQNDTLYLVGRRDIAPGGNDAEEMRVRVPFTGAGTYQLTGASAEFADIVTGISTSLPATGQMELATYDGIFSVGTITLTAQTAGGTRRFTAGTFDVPVFMSFGEVPPMPLD